MTVEINKDNFSGKLGNRTGKNIPMGSVPCKACGKPRIVGCFSKVPLLSSNQTNASKVIIHKYRIYSKTCYVLTNSRHLRFFVVFIFVRYVLDEYCTHRRSLFVRSYIDALTGAGNIKGIELIGVYDHDKTIKFDT